MQPVPVVPMALQNLWGSTFSRVENGRAMARPLRRGLFSRVGLVVGPAIEAAEVSLPGLRARISTLLGQSTSTP
jgi:hypothetical protein